MHKKDYKNLDFIELLENIKNEEPYNLYPNEENSKKQKYINKFYNIYKETPRHYYSDISQFCYLLEEQDRDYLITNMEILEDYYEYILMKKLRLDKETLYKQMFVLSKDYECVELLIKIKKLIDHIKLETYRNIHLRKNIEDTSLDALNSQLKEVNDSLNKELNHKVKETDIKLNKKFENIQIESITVISIFSAIVMTFFGGLSFYGEAISNMNEVSIHLTLSVITIVSIAMVNVFYILFYLIGKIIDKPLVDSLQESGSNNDNLFIKFIQTHSNIFFVNGIFLLVLILIFYLFYKRKIN